MSASLVGSEMCIRDRQTPPLRHPGTARGARHSRLPNGRAARAAPGQARPLAQHPHPPSPAMGLIPSQSSHTRAPGGPPTRPSGGSRRLRQLGVRERRSSPQPSHGRRPAKFGH
eukprot:1582384-Alexandrium_andersonii.AAC.1